MALTVSAAAGPALGADRADEGLTTTRGAAMLPAALTTTTPTLQHARLGGEHASDDVRELADWVVRSRDNGSAPFMIIDKKHTRLYVFDPQAQLVATSPVLLGAARGDDSVPGIGERKIENIRPFERTTPAGRFVAERGINARHEEVVWIDYDAAVSMHRVLTTNPKERRLHRLATPTTADNRISYGCINVPVAFFNAQVSPVFRAGKRAIVYILPETRSWEQQFERTRVAPSTAHHASAVQRTPRAERSRLD